MINKRFLCNQLFVTVIIAGLMLLIPLMVFGSGQGKLERIKNAGKLVVGTSADYPPYEFHLLSEKEGDLVGIDIDIAKAIASELGVELEIKDLIFSRIFEALDSGKIDLAIAGLHPSEVRREIADFSEVYYQAIQSIIIRKDNAAFIHTVEDLRGKKVATQKDSLQQEMARTQIAGATFEERETIEELIIILKKGLVDAVILEEPVADSYVRRDSNFTLIKCKKFNDKMGSSIALKKGNSDLLKEINRILTKLISEGKIDEFVANAKMLTDKR